MTTASGGAGFGVGGDKGPGARIRAGLNLLGRADED
jgi:hypothetical protein